jgi:hypothetical protein
MAHKGQPRVMPSACLEDGCQCDEFSGGGRANRAKLPASEEERREAFEEFRALCDLIPKLQGRKAKLQRAYAFREK